MPQTWRFRSIVYYSNFDTFMHEYVLMHAAQTRTNGVLPPLSRCVYLKSWEGMLFKTS